MAKFEVTIDDDFIKTIEKMADFDSYAKELLEAGAPIVESEMHKQLSKHKDTGAMSKSVKTLVKKNKWGWFSATRPTGKDSKGIRNMEKYMYLEFGTEKQPPRPTVTKIVKNAEPKVLERMQEVFDGIFKQ